MRQSPGATAPVEGRLFHGVGPKFGSWARNQGESPGIDRDLPVCRASFARLKAAYRALQSGKSRERSRTDSLVVVQAVAGSSPVAHPHKVAAQGVFLCERYNYSARAELPMSYQFFGGTGEFELASLGLRV